MRAHQLALGLLLFLPGAVPATWADTASYTFDQHAGTIEFAVDQLGMFTTRGHFTKFQANLAVDLDRPERTRIAVQVDAASIDMPWEDGVAMLRSPDYLDVQNHPQVNFRSTSVAPITPDHYNIQGLLEIRGVTQPFALDTKLASRRRDPGGLETADFIAAGQLKRSAFGMTANQNFISDNVKLTITVRLQLRTSAKAS